MKKSVLSIMLVICLSVGAVSPCHANSAVRKLGRGIANVVTSPLEVCVSVYHIFSTEGPAAAATYGVVDGVVKTTMRAGVGVFEVITFPFPFPAEYDPILEPEFLLSPDED